MVAHQCQRIDRDDLEVRFNETHNKPGPQHCQSQYRRRVGQDIWRRVEAKLGIDMLGSPYRIDRMFTAPALLQRLAILS